MELESAIQQYLASLKASAARERVEIAAVVLEQLQDYLEADEKLTGAEAIRASDLRAFIRDWYLHEEEVTPEAATELVSNVVRFAGWLDEQLASPRFLSPAAGFFAARKPDATLRPPMAPELQPLEESLTRAAEATVMLRHYARRHDLASDLPVDEEESGTAVGTLTAGVTRVVRLDEVDYDRAEEDWFELDEIREQSLSLHSPSRRQLGEGPAAPVRVPAAVTPLLQTGDRLHLEIAPAGTEWEIINATIVCPGGLDEQP